MKLPSAGKHRGVVFSREAVYDSKFINFVRSPRRKLVRVLPWCNLSSYSGDDLLLGAM
jgi:hypothetical protein